MRSITSGSLRVVLVAAMASALLGGCGAAPSQVGAAAIVGDATISVDRVQQQLSDVLDKEGEEAKAQLVAGDQLGDVSRQIVTLEVRHELVTAAARRENVSVDEAEVTELIDQLGGAEAASAGTIFDPETFRTRARDQLLAVELGRDALRNLSVTVDFTSADTRAAALQKVQELAAAGPQGARELIRADVERGVAAGLDQQIAAADNPDFASAPVFGVGEATVVAFPAQQGGSWLVMVVSERSTDGPAVSAAQINALDPAVLQAAGIRQLAPVAQDLGVRVNPRYGVWDPVALEVAPNEDETAGFVTPLRQPSPA